MLLLAAAAWAGGLVGVAVPAVWGPGGAMAATLLLLGAVVLTRRARTVEGRGHAWTVAGMVVVLLGVALAGGLRARTLATDPVAALAAERAAVRAEVVVTTDPRVREGRFEDYVAFRGRVELVSGRGRASDVHTPVLVVADPQWRDLRLGASVELSGRLGPASDPGVAAVLSARGEPRVTAAPDVWWRAAESVRASMRAAVAHRPADQRALVPALVVGDDADMDPRLVEDVQATGLTHLTAVSGTNLTLLVGFLLLLARWLGVRGRGRPLVALVGIGGFLLLARAEPSVVRAAAMGTVALVGLGSGGARRGCRTLGVAVVCLLLVDPWLAVSVGFALSATATAGILLLAPSWRDAMARWLPRWLPRWTAEAVAVPLAAQLACTPLVAAVSGQVSLVAVVANLLVAPVVGPATVLGLAAALVGLVWEGGGQLLGTLASWCVGWIVVVATYGARLPGSALDWDAGPASLTVLVLLCLGIVAGMPWLLGRPATGVLCVGVMVLAVLVGPVRPGWPPGGWVVAACDVGQGDALVLNAGAGAGVAVDAGPDARAAAACLRRLGIDRLPVVVLTHFHADHVDGLAGLVAGHEVGEVLVSPLRDPPGGVVLVAETLRGVDADVRAASAGDTIEAGEVHLQVLWPPPDPPAYSEGSAPNNASLVVLATVGEVSLLLTGDVEPPAQRALGPVLAGLRVDVLKLPHHGSAEEDLDVLSALGPRVVLVSVGADNDYGHPAPEALAPFEAAGVPVLRTDLDGDLVVVSDDGTLATTTSG